MKRIHNINSELRVRATWMGDYYTYVLQKYHNKWFFGGWKDTEFYLPNMFYHPYQEVQKQLLSAYEAQQRKNIKIEAHKANVFK